MYALLYSEKFLLGEKKIISQTHHTHQWLPGEWNCCSEKQGMLWLMPQLDILPFSMGCIWKQEGDFLGVWKRNGKMFSKLNISKHNASTDVGSLLRLVHLSECPDSSEICVSSSNCEWAECSVSCLCRQLRSIAASPASGSVCGCPQQLRP